MKPFSGVIRSSCRGCHGVCQVLVHLDEGKIVRVSGDPDSPTSRGFICPKGKAAPEMLYHQVLCLYGIQDLKRIGVSHDQSKVTNAQRPSELQPAML